MSDQYRRTGNPQYGQPADQPPQDYPIQPYPPAPPYPPQYGPPAYSQPQYPQPYPMVAAGTNGQVSFDGYTVTITRNGFMARQAVGGAGGKSIPVGSIGGIEWRPVTAMHRRGFIHFAVVGSVSGRGRASARSTDQWRDADGVQFSPGQQPQFERLRAAVEQAMGQARMGGPVVVQQPPMDAGARLEQLEGLRFRGLITEEEYARQRTEILRSI